MGEWSKKIGEQGENIVEYFFENIIGYKNIYRSGLSIKCSYNDEHKRERAKGDRNTHGVDGLVSYNCPLVDELLEIGIVSSKFTNDKYPNNPKVTFKEYFIELAYTIRCFKNSEVYKEINSSATNVSDTTTTGLLFWLSNNDESIGQDLITEISNTTIRESGLIYDKIIVVDNARMEFLCNLIVNVKNVFGEQNVDFIYPKTGMNNISSQKKSFGKKMPLQFISSNIIPIRIVKGSDVYLLIGSRDNFNEEDLRMIIGLSKEFNHLEATTKTIITFPDYNKMKHTDTVKKVLGQSASENYISQISVSKDDFDFRNL